MKLLVFQHVDCEHPGSLRRFLTRDGIQWTLSSSMRANRSRIWGIDALWVMGGPMDVWDVDEHPWMIPEKAAIRHWVREL